MDEAGIIPSGSDTVWPPGPTRPDIEPLLPGEAEAAMAKPRVITAEWALWGKEANETSYHVLRCSKGDKGELREKDFSKIITRYSPGELDDLPHYTVSWIPGVNRAPEYIVLGVHELAPADPRQEGGRSRRDAAGREIVFVRLFCLRYAELAEHQLTYQDQPLGYQDLLKAVAGIQFPADRTEPVRITLPAELSPVIKRGTTRKQAEQVAAMLLSGRQICVLGADDVPVADRLRFIDTVMALLPYGLRASMSAATLASSTSQDLKLRLFFASMPRAGGRLASGRARGEDFLVEWGKLDEIAIPDQAAGLYRQWLKDLKSQAPAVLADQVVPVSFAPADIRRMVGNLPQDKTVLATLDDLGKDLRAAELDTDDVKDAVKRLRRYLVGEDKPADPAEIQRQYRRQVCGLRLLADDGRLSPQLKGQLYDQLLRVAFGPALTYDDYRDIEESVGFPLHTSLRTALAKFHAADWLAYLLAREAQPGFRGGKEFSDGTPVPAGNPFDEVITRVATATLQPRHGRVVLGWALRDLHRRGGLYAELLAARGYLAQAYEYLYRDEPDMQVVQLREVLKIAFGGQLSRPEIDMVLASPAYLPTPALGRAVTGMTGYLNQGYAQERFRQASLRAQGVPDWAMFPQYGSRWLPWRWGRRNHRLSLPPDQFEQPQPAASAAAGPRNHVLSTESPWAHPRILGALVIAALALFALSYFTVLFMIRGG